MMINNFFASIILDSLKLFLYSKSKSTKFFLIKNKKYSDLQQINKKNSGIITL